ncbi:MAG: ribulose-phosphate 3-epimerase [Limisphaerales bacterium]|jgi:ribulose-phosphate 3-epimerase|nr:ribulose-phosphate 3-epimerase [Verrucomicrobiota bacterium]
MIIAPSLLAANLGKLESEIKRITKAGADWIHLDIMDGHFVQNLSFGPDFLKMIKKHTHLPCDVHLMCSKPEVLLPLFLEAGADNITVHAELGERAVDLIKSIHAEKRSAGISINPPTPFAIVEPFLDIVDLLLVMSVNPGYGGQPFVEETLQKIERADQWRRQRGRKFRLEVDGGINFDTVKECARRGADTIVSGTTIFHSACYRRAIERMRRNAVQAAAEAG